MVGAGPVGLTLGNLLGRHGISTRIFERRTTQDAGPRAVGIDDESLRIWQQCGLSREMEPFVLQGDEGDVVFTYRSGSGKPLFELRQQGRPFGYARGALCLQPGIEDVLREGLKRYPCVELHPGHTVEAVGAGAGGAWVRGETSAGERFECHARFVVGCDGGRSIVRSSAGMVMRDRPYPTPWLVVDLHSPAAEREGRRAGVEVWCDHRRPAVTMALPKGYRRWEFLLREGESEERMLEDSSIFRLIAARAPVGDDSIVRKRAVTYRIGLVDRYRRDSIFLAGDAAHVTSPFAGQGMTTGLRDAANLSWKLAAVVKGFWPESLLDTYEQERRPHQRRMLALARRMGRVMMPRHALEQRVIEIALGAMSRMPALRAHVEIRGAHMAPAYRRGFLCPGGAAGSYLPQPTLPDGRKLDDLLGDWFSVIAIGASANESMSPEEKELWVSRGARWVELPNPVDGLASGKIQPPRDRLLIVRPDRFISEDRRA